MKRAVSRLGALMRRKAAMRLTGPAVAAILFTGPVGSLDGQTAPGEDQPGEGTRLQLGLDFLYQDFGNMGSGPGVEASFAVTTGAGLRIGLGGELYFGNTTESFGEIVDWFATGLFGELGYRFGHSRWRPYVAVRPELLWKEYDLPWEEDAQTVIEHYTELEFAIGAVAGVETELSRHFGVSFTGIFTAAERQNRFGVRVGVRYLF